MDRELVHHPGASRGCCDAHFWHGGARYGGARVAQFWNDGAWVQHDGRRLHLGLGLQATGRESLSDNYVGVGDVGYRLGGCSEDNGQLSPTHWEGQWETHQIFFTVLRWEQDIDFWNIGCPYSNSIKPIGDVNL
jgi:hypothetical protein